MTDTMEERYRNKLINKEQDALDSFKSDHKDTFFIQSPDMLFANSLSFVQVKKNQGYCSCDDDGHVLEYYD